MNQVKVNINQAESLIFHTDEIVQCINTRELGKVIAYDCRIHSYKIKTFEVKDNGKSKIIYRQANEIHHATLDKAMNNEFKKLKSLLLAKKSKRFVTRHKIRVSFILVYCALWLLVINSCANSIS